MRSVIAKPRAFVARLVLADLIAKRGDGPLERKRIVYGRRTR
jgi:hypothetical protein